MSIDVAAILAKLKALEASAPGFLAALKADLAAAETSDTLNKLLGLVSPSFAGAEQAALKELETVVDVIISTEATVLPFVEELLSKGAALAQFLPQIIDLFKTLVPKAA